MEKISSRNAPAPAGHYEQGWTHGGLIFVSGQLPIDPMTGSRCTGPSAEQAAQCLSNLKAVLEATGSSLDRVLKVTVFVADIALWGEIDAAYAQVFGDHKPARSVVPTGALHHGFKVEVDAIAAA